MIYHLIHSGKMSEDRSWMYRRIVDQIVSVEFKNGVERFIQFALRNHNEAVDCEGRIRCPCSLCKNLKWVKTWEVQRHLYRKGFVEGYTNWTCHGETLWSYKTVNIGSSSSYAEMVIDAAGPEFNVREEHVTMEELPNKTAERFYQLLKDADEPLWDGCQNHSRLSAVSQLLNLKSEFHISEICFDRLLLIIKSMLPQDEKLPENFYRAKKMVNELGLQYEKIDACPNHCMLYYKEDKHKVACSMCGHDRFKSKRGDKSRQKDIPYSSLRYFPLTPRLQRMYMSPKIAQHMRWHAERIRQDDNIINHPADAEAWSHFNRSHPNFSKESRNVRLGLCTDGFNPFGGSVTSYSSWPVFMTPYNLPPNMCMKRENIFLCLLIPGPKSPTKRLDIYLRPLIEELKTLWTNGVTTYDVSVSQNFNMKVALMWTISDFPAYGMLSGWSTHGKLACPYCLDSTKSFVLKHGGKCCWFDCHRRFLPMDHSFRRQRDAFLKNKIEIEKADYERLSGLHIRAMVQNLPDITQLPNSTRQLPGFGKDHNWVKRSIFWELPYWSSLLIRHNLDVMHVEKNVFDNVFNTIMDVKGKSKDNVNARLDMKLLCKRPELELLHRNGRTVKPKAIYALGTMQIKEVCSWLKQLKFPDGYASNIARCVNANEGKISGMKSHDCHVFMQRLLPILFRDMLPKPIWGAISELSQFFKILCSSTFRYQDLETIEQNVIPIVCKLEKIFPPSFFDSMEHLLIHLPYEAKVGGPVQFRWMYPFER